MQITIKWKNSQIIRAGKAEVLTTFHLFSPRRDLGQIILHFFVLYAVWNQSVRKIKFFPIIRVAITVIHPRVGWEMLWDHFHRVFLHSQKKTTTFQNQANKLTLNFCRSLRRCCFMEILEAWGIFVFVVAVWHVYYQLWVASQACRVVLHDKIDKLRAVSK